MKLRRLSVLVLSSVFLSVVSVSTSRAELIERVIAVVNDDAIFLSELRQKAAPFLARAMSMPAAQRMQAIEQIQRQLLDRMIDERLILQVADEENISISTREVNEAIGNVRAQSGLDESDFWEAVRGQGFTPQQYRQDVRQQLLRLKVLNQRVRNRVNITEDDVRRRYDEMAVRARRESTFQAEYIRLPLAADASATELHQAMREAEQIRAAIDSIDDFQEAREEYGGGETGSISERDLAPELGAALLALEEGEISEPVRSEGANAIFIFHLQGRELVAEGLPAYEEVRMDIYREMMQEQMGRQEELFLTELRRRADIERRLDP